MKRNNVLGTSFLVFSLIAAVAGCGGGASNPSPAPTSTASGGAGGGGSATFPCGTVSGNATGTLSPTVGSAANFPALGSCTASVTFQSGTTIASGTSISATSSLSAPAGAPSPLPTNPAGSNAPTTIAFVAFSLSSGSITIPSGATASPAQSVTLATTGTCSTYYSLFGTASGWQGGYSNAGTLSGTTVTFPSGTNSNPITLSTGTTYYIAFVCF